jgi:excisionase family DNA binding protein
MIVSNDTSLITIEELSSRLKLHRNTVGRLVEQNVITGLKIGGQWRFDYEEVIENIKKNNARERLK